MIKSIISVVLFAMVFQCCKNQPGKNEIHTTNYIDSLKTAAQIEAFVSKIDKRYIDFKVNQALNYDSRFTDTPCKKISDSLKIKPWQIADFDNNGLDDILIVGPRSNNHDIVCILDKGFNHYEIKSITRRIFQECTFPVVINNKIKYYFETNRDRENWKKPRKLENIMLTYQFGDFIEESVKPANHKIAKIEYETTGCLGSCPIFNLVINADRTAKWKADMFNEFDDTEIKGDFISTITADKYNDIVNLLNYMDFSTLKDDYAVSWTDDQSSTLTITYDNGKKKTISDYGLIGTYGLDRVHQLLFALRTNQKWTK